MSEPYRYGEYCLAQCTAPARYLGYGMCIWVSAMDNDLHVGPVGVVHRRRPDLPHATNEEVAAASAALRAARVYWGRRFDE